MESDKGPIATEAPLSAPSAPQTIVSPPAASDSRVADVSRTKSLKRARETTPTSPAGVALDLSPSKIARLVGLATRLSPVPLTGAAALEDERRRKAEEQRQNPPAVSQNPSQKALSDLMSGATMAISRPQDAPPPITASAADTVAKALQPIAIPPPVNNAVAELRADVSSESVAPALASLGSAGAPVTESPVPMDIDNRPDRPYAPQPEAQMEDKTNTSMSYPGLLPPGDAMPAPSHPPRGMSLDTAARSPSSKKHKCPYCETEFTRHHNLKSHLLTHSQEKPYVCQSCDMRFRRLHDLKRHSKLHTGEKPHVCPKCDRKFARGDALARHSKGAGGCAGRRSSMGSFGGDEDYDTSLAEGDESGMTGVVYDADNPDLSEEERRHLSLPSIKAQHVTGQPTSEGYGAHSRTYPPAGTRNGATGGLFPPNVERGTTSSTAGGHTSSTSGSSVPLSAGAGSLYSQTGMTESPKPLSPGATQNNHPGGEAGRQGAAYQQQFGHRQAEHGAGSTLAHPSHGAAGTANAAGSHAAGSSGGVDNANNLFASGNDGVWAYIQTLEASVKNLSEKLATLESKEVNQDAQITLLTNEVNALRQQLASDARQAPPPVQS